MSAALCLATYGVGVSVTGPLILRRCSSTGHAPGVAVAAWLAAAGSAVGSWQVAAGLTIAAGPPWLRAAAVAAVIALLIRWVWAGAVTVGRDLRRRARHRDGLRLIARLDRHLGVWLVDTAEPLAYAVPGRGGLIVLTRGARERLSARQLSAVLAHERAHLSERHELISLAANVCSRALPWLPLFSQVGPHVALLLEMRADDAAARVHGARTVAGALAALSREAAPAGAFAAGGATVTLRTRRLRRAHGRRARRAGMAAAAACLLVFLTCPFLAALDVLCLHMI